MFVSKRVTAWKRCSIGAVLLSVGACVHLEPTGDEHRQAAAADVAAAEHARGHSDHGVALHLKTLEKARTVSNQMRRHLAWAQANNFDRTPCSLYIKGVKIPLVGDMTIEVTSDDPNIARAVRDEARQMFGELANTVSPQ